jgi:hypothetical protein
LISLRVGANVPRSPSYVLWEAASRIINGNTVVVQAPAPVALDSKGEGSVDVPVGVWFVTEIVPGRASLRRAVSVQASEGALQYATLPEVSSPADVGFGPTWAQQAANAAALALDSKAAAYAYLQTIQGIVSSFEPGSVVRSVNGQAPGLDGDVDVVVEGTVTLANISDATEFSRKLMRAESADIARGIIGAGTDGGTTSGGEVGARRYDPATKTYPKAGNAPADQLLIWYGPVAPPVNGDYARSPSMWLRTA